MIPTGAGAAIGKAGAPDSNAAGPNGAITPGPPHEGSRVTPEGRIISVPPDVCLTPRGSAMVPVPDPRAIRPNDGNPIGPGLLHADWIEARPMRFLCSAVADSWGKPSGPYCEKLTCPENRF